MAVYDIVLLGFAPRPGADPAHELARAFGIPIEQARAMVAEVPLTVKRNLDEELAEKYFHILRELGARVELERRDSVRPALHSSPAGRASLPAPAVARSEPPPGELDWIDRSPPASIPPDPGLAGGWASPSGRPPSARPPSVRPPSVRPAFLSERAVPAKLADDLRSRDLRSRERVPFLPALLSAVGYPWQVRAIPIFAGVAVIAQLLTLVPLVGNILGLGVLLTFLFGIVRATANGDDDVPVTGEITDLWDFFGPVLRYVIALAVCAAPAAIAGYYLPRDAAYLPTIGLLAIFGLLYLPASMMVAALGSGCLAPLNPIAGVMIIARVPLAYAMTAIATGLVLLLNTAMEIGLAVLLAQVHVPFLPGLIAVLAGLPLTAVAFRMLGLFLRLHAEELGLSS